MLQQQGFDAAAHLQQQEAEKSQVLSVEETELITQGAMPEVLGFAIEMEIRARDNYRELASHFEDGETRAFCNELASEEQNHHDLLSKLRGSLDMPLDERPAL
jgi:rubrerythrin